MSVALDKRRLRQDSYTDIIETHVQGGSDINDSKDSKALESSNVKLSI